jgi:hypothetical protein
LAYGEYVRWFAELCPLGIDVKLLPTRLGSDTFVQWIGKTLSGVISLSQEKDSP